MTAKTSYRATAPNGAVWEFTTTRTVTHVRFLDAPWRSQDGLDRYIPTMHGSEKAARTGPNATRDWNKLTRHVVAVEVI